MSIVVTGAAGFIGANLVKALNRRGETDIVAVDNLTRADKFANLVDCEIGEYVDKEEFLARLADGDFDDDVTAVLHEGACSDTMETDGRYVMRNNYRYSIAVLDWTQSYTTRQEARAKEGMKPEDSLAAKNKKLCATIKEKNTANVQEGMDNLNKAIQLRQDYEDAMAYLNLMYRERADIECDDPGARTEDLKKADEWQDKTMATRKAKAEKQPGGGAIVMDENK